MTEIVKNPWFPSIRPETGTLLLALVVVLTAVVYGPVCGFEFVNFDDDAHIYRNPHVRTGLTGNNILWAFGIHGPSQWHPLAWLSHQLDATLFGANVGDSSAGGHHLVNVVLHLVNVVLVFQVFRDFTGKTAPAVLSAAVFGLHPLNVESVAWISERRNVLCLCFCLFTLRMYWRYVHQGGAGNYLAVCILHAAALMAKPLAVTLPCLFVMLDVWPMQRWSPQNRFRPLVEKLPLFGLSAVACVLTVACQQAAGVVSSLAALPLETRVLNAVAAYGDYLRDFAWPAGLCVFYPHPAILPGAAEQGRWGSVILGAVLIVSITLFSLWQRRSAPWLLFGWLWFLGTLVPMIGLVQVGVQQRADRYVYLPMLGLLLGISTLIPLEHGSTSSRTKRWGIGVCCLMVFTLAFRTWEQVGTWRDSITLFEQALAVNPQNPFAHLNLGLARQERGEWDRAAADFSEALRINPNYALAHYNLGVLEWEQGRQRSAGHHFDEAIRLDPHDADALVRRGAMLGMAGQLDAAEQDFAQACRVDSEHADAAFNLGLIREHRGQIELARESYQETLRRDAEFVRAAEALARLKPR